MRTILIFFLINNICYANLIHRINLLNIITIESDGEPNKINKGEQAYGLMQIRQPALDEYNKAHRTNLKLEDLLYPFNNIVVGEWYLNERIPQMILARGEEICLVNILIAYNAGISYVRGKKSLPIKTVNYISKYLRLCVEQNNKDMNDILYLITERGIE